MLYVLIVLLLVSECCGGNTAVTERAMKPKGIYPYIELSSIHPIGISRFKLNCYLNALLQSLVTTSFVGVVACVSQQNNNAPIARALTTFFNLRLLLISIPSLQYYL